MDAGNVDQRAAGEGHGGPSPASFSRLILVVAVIFGFSGYALAAGLSDGQTNADQASPTGRETAPPAVAATNQGKQNAERRQLNLQRGAALGAPLYQAPDTPPTPDELAAAQGMESMLVNLMIEEMRKSVPENELVPLTQGERIYRQMLDQEYAKKISETGSLGIADLVVAQMHGKR